MTILRLLHRSVLLGTGEISSQRAALLPRRHYTAPWQPFTPSPPSAQGYKACHYSAEVLGSIQERMFHNIIKQSGRPPALAQAALLHRRHHTTPWRGEFSASTHGRPRNNIKINVQPPDILLPRRYFSTPAPSRSIAHVVARHSSESIVYKKWFPFPLMVHFLRRMEIEADHIGMLLMAAAGFDPHIAPMVLEKQGNDIYHPSGKKRARLLSRAKVMDEALELYREVMPAKAPEV